MKIAFLFMIYDLIEKEDIWYKFFKDIDSNKFSIYIHAKDNNQIKFKNEFFKNYVIKENYPTEWACYSLVHVQNRLLELAFKDENNKKFILLSGTHIPLHKFDFIYNILLKNDNSYFSFEHYKNQTSDLLDRFKTINNFKNYDLNNWNYASQWSILNRNITKFILDNEEEFITIFSKSKYPDEYAYINYLFENKIFKNLTNKKTTYISLVPSVDKKKYRSVPHTFDNNEIDERLINNIKSSYLFMRKVVNTCDINENWIFKDTPQFSLIDKPIKLNKESFPKLSQEEYNNIQIKKKPIFINNNMNKIITTKVNQSNQLQNQLNNERKVKIKKI
jgi:hypothetical protein